MPRYQRKLVLVDAWPYGTEPYGLACRCPADPETGAAREPHVHTQSGPNFVNRGDWILRGDDGNYSVRSDAAFAAAYEVEEIARLTIRSRLGVKDLQPGTASWFADRDALASLEASMVHLLNEWPAAAPPALPWWKRLLAASHAYWTKP